MKVYCFAIITLVFAQITSAMSAVKELTCLEDATAIDGIRQTIRLKANDEGTYDAFYQGSKAWSDEEVCIVIATKLTCQFSTDNNLITSCFRSAEPSEISDSGFYTTLITKKSVSNEVAFLGVRVFSPILLHKENSHLPTTKIPGFFEHRFFLNPQSDMTCKSN